MFSQLIMVRLFICVFPVLWQFVTATELQVSDNKGSWCRRSDSLDNYPVKGYFDRCYLSGAQRHTVLWRTTQSTWQIYINSLRKCFTACHGRQICFQFVYVEGTSLGLLEAISDIIWEGGLLLITFDPTLLSVIETARFYNWASRVGGQ